MKVGVKLFNRAGEVVHERDEAPKEVGGAVMVTFKGVHYSYRGLFSRNERQVLLAKPYAKFEECNPPLALD